MENTFTEHTPRSSSKLKIIIILVVIALIGTIVGWFLLRKTSTVSPISENGDVRVIFISPQPSSSPVVASPSATPKSSPKVSPKASPKSSPNPSTSLRASSSPGASSSASPSATPQ